MKCLQPKLKKLTVERRQLLLGSSKRRRYCWFATNVLSNYTLRIDQLSFRSEISFKKMIQEINDPFLPVADKSDDWGALFLWDNARCIIWFPSSSLRTKLRVHVYIPPKMKKDGISYQYLSCFANNELEKIVRIGRQVREGSDSRTFSSMISRPSSFSKQDFTHLISS